jgi:hypothetical protein
MSVRILQTYVSLQPRSLALFEMFQPRVENLLDSMHLRSPHRFRVVETLIDRIKTLLDIVKPRVDVRMRTIKPSVHIRPQSVHVRSHVAEPAIVYQNSDQHRNRRIFLSTLALLQSPALFQSSSTFRRTSSGIRITSGHGRVKPSPGHFFVASTPIFDP